MSSSSRLRASDEDREHVVERLRRAASEGRIAAEELEQRVHAALTAQTYGELDAVVADLPGPRTRRARPGAVAPARRTAGGWVATAVRDNPMLLLFAIPVVAVTAALLLAATVMWAVLMIVVLVLGGRPRVGPPPWVIARRRAMREMRRRPGGHWA